MMLRQLSRTTFILACAPPESQFKEFKKKQIDTKLFSSQAAIVHVEDYHKQFSIAEINGELKEEHRDAHSLRLYTHVTPLTEMPYLQKLELPLSGALNKDAGPFNKDFIDLLKNDQITDLLVDVRMLPTPIWLENLKNYSRLKKLTINLNATVENVSLLNKYFTKEVGLEDLDIRFRVESDKALQKIEIKFPKYLKKLKALTLANVFDPTFSETLLDMASQKNLRELSLRFQPNLSLPNFADALSKFKNLNYLSLCNLPMQKLNYDGMMEVVASLENLRSFQMEEVEFTDQQFRKLLESINSNTSIRELKIMTVAFETTVKQDYMRSFLANNKTLTTILLSNNQIPNLLLLSYMSLNTSLKQLIIVNQIYFGQHISLDKKLEKTKPNQSVERLHLGLGESYSIQPFVLCFITFPKLRALELCNMKLCRLAVMALDNYLVQNDELRKLKLIDVHLTQDLLQILFPTLCTMRRLKTLNLTGNPLKDNGAYSVEKIVQDNVHLHRLVLDTCLIREEGAVKIIKAVGKHKHLVKLSMQFNKFVINRMMIGLIGQQFMYKNRVLRILNLAGASRSSSISEEEYRLTVDAIKEGSLLKVFVL